MLTIDHINCDADQRIINALILTFRIDVLPIFEAVYPIDLRPRQALIAKMKWLQGEITIEEQVNAANLANFAADATIRLDNYIAGYAARTTAYVTHANSAAFSAAFALSIADKSFYIHNKLLQLLPLILEYKIENHQKFNRAEEIFEYLSEPDKDKFLFNLDILC